MLNLNKSLILLLCSIGIILGIYFGTCHFIAKEQQLGYNKAVAEYTKKALDAERLARAKEAALSAQVEAAQNEAELRRKELEKANHRLIVSDNRLRDIIASNQRRLSQVTRDAASKYSMELGRVIEECSEKYSELAKQVDECASDNETLKQAWPK